MTSKKLSRSVLSTAHYFEQCSSAGEIFSHLFYYCRVAARKRIFHIRFILQQKPFGMKKRLAFGFDVKYSNIRLKHSKLEKNSILIYMEIHATEFFPLSSLFHKLHACFSAPMNIFLKYLNGFNIPSAMLSVVRMNGRVQRNYWRSDLNKTFTEIF